MKSLLGILCVLMSCPAVAQTQACPVNSNFSLGSLTHWYAYTGKNGANAVTLPYDSTVVTPNGTIGASTITEYQLSSVNGITVNTGSSYDAFGRFITIPNINGYQYFTSVRLGSTSISTGSNGAEGGYIRGISYRINVPLFPNAQPYTMTYAYAMVLENGTHNSNEQPLFSATLSTNDSVITCASPKYYLPTLNNASSQGTGAELDTAGAEAEGFTLSSTPSPNPNPNSAAGGHLLDVWYKSWREVTFDLSPYRGQQVTLTFEADNCVPGGHFAYAYVALRSTCTGLMISGDTIACTNSDLTYSVPSLTNGSYNWTVPAGWNIVSGADSNIISVDVGTLGGLIIAHEVNGCANLHDTLALITAQPTIAGTLAGDSTVCAGLNSNTLLLSGERGNVLNWLSSTNGGATWSPVPDTSSQLSVSNLQSTTTFVALVQNGESCKVDSSLAATIVVDPQSVGGTLTPLNTDICTGQDQGAILTLGGAIGNASNWQSAEDTSHWTAFNPADTTYTYSINGISVPTQYRVIVKSGVCPSDTSSVAFVNILPALFPVVAIDPADTTICFGNTASFTANITVGTTYAWSPAATLSGPASGPIDFTPYALHTVASPDSSTDYVLTLTNTGCPNPLIDTFKVIVYPRIYVNAGHDTAVVVNQPLQLNATSSDLNDIFTWTPGTDLSSTEINDPIAILGSNIDTIRYFVTATSPSSGCYASASILVQVFTTPPDIYVPNAFTPGINIDNIFKPILVGITSLQFFRVYNRYGQLVYSTSSTETGWDGTVDGKPQEPSAYVWMVEGTTYLGKTIFKKGTVVLIR